MRNCPEVAIPEEERAAFSPRRNIRYDYDTLMCFSIDIYLPLLSRFESNLNLIFFMLNFQFPPQFNLLIWYYSFLLAPYIFNIISSSHFVQ